MIWLAEIPTRDGIFKKKAVLANRDERRIDVVPACATILAKTTQMMREGVVEQDRCTVRIAGFRRKKHLKAATTSN